MGRHVLTNVGTEREARRTDFVAPGYDPDAVHDSWLDPEDVVPADWEGGERA